MAKITIDWVLHLGTPSKHNMTDWQVSLDPEFKVIVDESLKDENNLLEWHTPLPKIDGSGYYSDEDILYARARVWHGDIASNWIDLSDSQTTPAYLNDLEVD